MNLTTFYVVKGNSGSLLSPDTAVQLGIIRFINRVSSTDTVVGNYNDLFEGTGKVKDVKIKLQIENNVTPVAQRHRRIPIPMREKVEKGLRRLEDEDIIETVYGPTG